jgi:hypothetical protein
MLSNSALSCASVPSAPAVCNPINMRKLLALVIAATLALSLTACSGGSGGGSSGALPVNGTLSVNNGAVIQVEPKVAYALPVSLKGSAGVAALPVTVTSSDSTIATVSHSTCNLSSVPGQDTCQVIVRGVGAGELSLSATAPGYTTTSTHASIKAAGSTSQYGSIQIGSFPSATPPSTSNFNMTAQTGDTVTLATSITNFTTPLDGVPILLSIAGGGTITGNPQCNVDSAQDANHYCLYKIALPSTPGTVTATATAVGTTAGDFSTAPTVTITVQTAAVPGTIVLQSDSGSVPLGMSGPFWAVLQDSSGVGDTVVTVSPSSKITINPGITAPPAGSYQQLSCTLSSSSPVCGFGVRGNTKGNATVSATAGSGAYTIQALNLSVNAPLSMSRTITFQNNDSNPVWVGITGGTATSYLTSNMVTTINPQTNGANVSCGPTNPGAACPTGSTCQQGGANPGSKTAYFCYWDQPVPANGYQISSTGTKQTSISISESSYDPIGDIVWSGNAYPRQGCTTDANGKFTCAIADCGSPAGSQACAVGTGGAPGIATLAEFTLQQGNNDYYDISIIGGANVATTFGPAAGQQTPTGDAYFCTTAGASAAQGILLASDWKMSTHVNAIFSGTRSYSVSSQTGGQQSTAYYHYIADPSGGRTGAGCASGAPVCATGLVCGYDEAAVNKGSTSDYQSSCGTHLAWLSANAIEALNATATNSAPFPFSTLASLYLCNAATNQSGYAGGKNPPLASAACGCTNWGLSSLTPVAGDVTFPSQFATPSQACYQNNQSNGIFNWTQSVLPTIAWLKQSCPTCYTYPFDDMSSTFQCNSTASPNSVGYLVQYNGSIPGQ